MRRMVKHLVLVLVTFAAILLPAAAADAGLARGPRSQWVVIDGGDGWQSAWLAFRGGEVARVMAAGRWNQPVQITVYSEDGNVVLTRTSRPRGTHAYVIWVPPADGHYTICVQNLSPAANRVLVSTN